jgi:hypothetical protein
MFFARLAATNGKKILDGLRRSDTMDELLRELDSLNRILAVSPHKNGVYTAKGLAETCRNFKVPKRDIQASGTGS